jgi:hypothetical protein
MQPTDLSMDEISRRLFLTRAARAFLGVGLAPAVGGLLPSLAAAQNVAAAAKAKQVIYLFMVGGMSHLDTFDPKPGTEVQGPTGVISSCVDGIQVSEHMARTAQQMDKIALVRSMSSKQGAHDRGQYFMRTNYAPIATTQHPGMGAWVANCMDRINPNLPANVLVGGGSQHPAAGFMPSRYAPLPIGNPEEGLKNSAAPRGVDDKTFERRLRLTDSFDHAFRQRYPQKQVHAYTDFYADAVKLMKSEDLKAFDLSLEKPETRAAYGQDRFGQGVLLARRLVEHGVRFVEVTFGGWDTHADNFDRIAPLAGALDQALAALLADLSASGMLNQTLVVLATEFGRTPQINGSDGRDHHPRVFTCLMAGGGVKGGYVHGASDAKGYAVEADGVGVTDFNATIAHALGIDHTEQIYSPDGRPFTFADKGRPVTALLA